MATAGSCRYQNKTAIYNLLFTAAAETVLIIAADSKHLGARIGANLVLRTWGSAMTHHPHVHGIVPGGGLSLDGQRWVACRPGFLPSPTVDSLHWMSRVLPSSGRTTGPGNRIDTRP
jgi:hypothetical protein